MRPSGLGARANPCGFSLGACGAGFCATGAFPLAGAPAHIRPRCSRMRASAAAFKSPIDLRRFAGCDRPCPKESCSGRRVSFCSSAAAQKRRVLRPSASAESPDPSRCGTSHQFSAVPKRITTSKSDTLPHGFPAPRTRNRLQLDQKMRKSSGLNPRYAVLPMLRVKQTRCSGASEAGMRMRDGIW